MIRRSIIDDSVDENVKNKLLLCENVQLITQNKIGSIDKIAEQYMQDIFFDPSLALIVSYLIT
ncbi:hypothetical protein I4U23_005716 [Adineta vaga]|nr:hypothetical protein I4U23_005716 [Adineta vaga]